jgi:LmbE family N-acetylglucosaminyl deacetylase
MNAATVLKKHLRDFRALLLLPEKKIYSPKRILPMEYVFIVSPHPDDEILMGAVALRLQTENKIKVINIAVTLGSSKERQKERELELKDATNYLNWQNIKLPLEWPRKKEKLQQLIKKYKPRLIIAPHSHDRHPTHEKTAKLVKDMLPHHTGYVAWAEYWSPQAEPNLLVEIDDKTHLKQVKGLEFHKGEIERNPYHLRLLGWQMDSVRRGSEWLGLKGATSAPILAGQLYRLEKFVNGKLVIKDCPHFAYSHSDLTDWLFE